MRDNPTTPLPASFDDFEPALVTRAEFLAYRNPDEKLHDSDAYQASVESLNRPHLIQVGSTRPDRRDRSFLVYQPPSDERTLIFRDAESQRTAAVLRDGVLYKTRHVPVPDWYVDARTREPVTLRADRVEEVKYPEEQVVSTFLAPSKLNRDQYPLVLQRFEMGGKRFELRAEREPRKNRRDTLVVLHDGLIVAMASDEWGATLTRVAEEYRRIGLGRFLADVWMRLNPLARSGGFTRAGQATSVAAWEQRVREFLLRGWYSELVRQGRITTDRVRDILAGVQAKIVAARLPSDEPRSEEEPSLLLYVDEDLSSFVLYDERFFAEPDEKYVYGHGFLRDSGSVGTFFFRLEYDVEYADLVTAIALQMARDGGEEIYVEDVPGDLVEWKRIPSAVYKDGRVMLSEDVLALRDLAQEERRERRKVDKYDELYHRLLELADSKWS